MDQASLERIGRALAQARRSGRPIPRGECDLQRIRSLEEAEAVQAEAAALFASEPIGHHLAATTSEIRAVLNCPEPITAPLFPADRLPSGSTLRVTRSMLGIGTQFAFVFGRCYPQEGESLSLETIAGAITSCHVGLQVLARRTEAGTPMNERLGTADFGLAECYVEGPSVKGWREADLPGCEVRLRVDGRTCTSGPASATLGSPLAPLLWLARHLDARERVIEAGAIVTSGSCLTLLQLTPGRVVSAVFGELGSVELHLV